MAVHAFDPSRQGQANLCELEARLISLCEFHDGQGYTGIPYTLNIYDEGNSQKIKSYCGLLKKFSQQLV